MSSTGHGAWALCSCLQHVRGHGHFTWHGTARHDASPWPWWPRDHHQTRVCVLKRHTGVPPQQQMGCHDTRTLRQVAYVPVSGQPALQSQGTVDETKWWATPTLAKCIQCAYRLHHHVLCTLFQARRPLLSLLPYGQGPLSANRFFTTNAHQSFLRITAVQLPCLGTEGSFPYGSTLHTHAALPAYGTAPSSAVRPPTVQRPTPKRRLAHSSISPSS